MSKTTETFDPRGSSFDDGLAEQGDLEAVHDAAIKAVFAHQLEATRKRLGLTKVKLAEMIGTSRSQLERMLDPENRGVTLEALERVAAALGKRIRLEMVDVPVQAKSAPHQQPAAPAD